MIYALYLTSLIISAVIAAILTLFFWQRRRMVGATPMVWMMVAMTVCSSGYVLQFTSTTLSGQIFATNIQYVGIVSLPVIWLVFSLRYTGRDEWLTGANLFVLAIIPVVTIVLAWTNGIDGLIWRGRHLEASGPFTIIAKTYGPWFWIHASYSYLLLISGVVFLLQRLFRPPRMYREQSIALLLCVIIPLVWNVSYVFDLFPAYPVDLSPSAFIISALVIAWGLFRLQLFEIIPIARNTVIEDANDAIIVLDLENRIIDVNPASQRIIGCSFSEVIGQPFAHIFSEQPRLVEYSSVHFAEAFTEVVIEKGEMRYYYESHISPLYGQHGSLIGRLVMLHDVTERRLIEARRKELEDKAQLASRLSTVGEMAAGIAHEINNPLTSIIGYADLLLQRDISSEIRADLEVINRGAKRVADILDRLLTFAGHHDVEWDYVDVNDIIETTIELRSHALANNNIEVINQFAPNLPETMADSGQLQQVFLNLIMNAETSMNESHGKGKLVVQTETTDNGIRISFMDDGLGIAKENLDKIFQPFFTARDVGKGTGLGLSICYGIIEEHSGSIYAESEFGQGATFIIELPIVVQQKPKVIKRRQATAPREIQSKTATIFVVDDEPDILEYLVIALGNEGHEIDTARTTADAFNKIENRHFDLMLLDIKLPGMSGIELYRHLQETASSLARRVIFITGDTMNTDTMAFLSQTSAPYITKPFDTNRLIEQIDHMLRKDDRIL